LTTAQTIRRVDLTTFLCLRVLRLDHPNDAAGDGPPTASGKANTENDAASMTRGKGCRILVVDDEDNFRRSLVFRLQQVYDATVEEAETGPIALQKVREGRGYDLILMDVSMPQTTGITVCQEMRAQGVDARIVLMSAHAENRAKAQDLGLPFLNKPLRKDALEKILLACRGETNS
jgi:CheY-like chemotaxis protein